MRVRYPRTPHLPWSPGATDDDERIVDATVFEGREVVVTEKLDGENTSLYRDGLHARSLDSAHHPSRAWVKALHGRISAEIPEDMRICGENLAARHSIPYNELLSFFYGFSVWRGDRCLDWDSTVEFLEQIGIPTPPVLYRGPWDAKIIRALRIQSSTQEGYVVRTVNEFDYAAFRRHCAKWVRPNHVQTDSHWMFQAMVQNGLAPEAQLWTIRSGGPLNPEDLWNYLGVGGRPSPVLDLGDLGTERLELAIASQLGSCPANALPGLAQRLPIPLAVRVYWLCLLHPRLHHPVSDDTRVGGLVSLGRSCDLRALHRLALATAPHDDANEQVQWSQLMAEDAGLLTRRPIAGWLADLRGLLNDLSPQTWTYVAGESLAAWAASRVRSPEEAAARAYPLRNHTPNELTLLVGPAGTGKSTAAKRYGGGVVNLDEIRAQGHRPIPEPDVLQQGLAQLEDAFQRHSHVIWDATNVTPSQRQLPLQIGRRHQALIRMVGVLTRPEVAVRRNLERTRTVPQPIVDRQWARLRWPAAHEAHCLDWIAEDANQ